MNKLIGSTLVAAILGLGPMATVQAAPEKFVIDSAHTYPFFEINHLGWSTTRGLFRKVTGTATLDFFDAANFPEATFESKGF